jgi:hypothetical protein
MKRVQGWLQEIDPVATVSNKNSNVLPIPAAERLLGPRVRIPPEAWMFVSCECLCCQVEASATGRSLVQSSPTDCGVCLSVIK